MTETDCLSLVGVSKTFGVTVALDDVSLTIASGELHALVGQNGSGKSTLIKVLAGFHQPDAGIASLAGDPIRLGDAAAARHAGLHFVHQDLGLVDTLDVVDNLALGRGYEATRGGRIRWRRERGQAAALLRDLGYPVDVRKPVGRLSSAERTAVAVARAIRHSDDKLNLLVLDEPTASLAGSEVRRLHALIRQLQDRGVAVLYVSHHLDEVLSLAGRVTVLRDGKVVTTRSTAGLTHGALAELMTGRAMDADELAGTAPVQRQPMMEIRAISGGTVQRFDLALRAHEIVGIAGLDGSGREYVGPLVFGAHGRSGAVTVAGTPVASGNPGKSVAAGIGYVPPNRAAQGLVMSMSVRQNLTLGDLKQFRRRGRLTSSVEKRDVADWVRRLGIRCSSPEAPMHTLSGGNQQKVLIGRWLRRSLRVLVLDEPTQGVDVGAQQEIHRLIADAAERGAAVLVCSSSEEELERLCHRVLVLRRGRVAVELCDQSLTATRILQESLRTEMAAMTMTDKVTRDA